MRSPPRSPLMRPPSIRRDRYVEPSFEPELDNAIPALHQCNGFSEDAKEPLLMSNEHLKASLNRGHGEDRDQFCRSAQGHLVVYNSKDQLSSSPELQGSSFFQASLNGINILAGRA